MKSYIKTYESFIDGGFDLKKFLEEFLEYANLHGINYFMYRGTKIRSNYKELTQNAWYATKPENRKSLGSKLDTFYNIIMSEDLSWKKFPRRKESFICTNSFQLAEDYIEFNNKNSFVGAIIPINYKTIKIGKTETADIWTNFADLKYNFTSEFNNLNTFDKTFKKIICLLNGDNELNTFDKYFKDYEQLRNQIEFVDKNIEKTIDIIKKIKYNFNYTSIVPFVKAIIEFKSEGMSFQDIMFEFLSADKCSIVEYHSIENESEPREYWFSDDCIIIKLNRKVKIATAINQILKIL